MLVTYNSILIITALLPNLNATAPKNPLRKLEQRCSICADTVVELPPRPGPLPQGQIHLLQSLIDPYVVQYR